jgi:hypothetical protein
MDAGADVVATRDLERREDCNHEPEDAKRCDPAPEGKPIQLGATIGRSSRRFRDDAVFFRA